MSPKYRGGPEDWLDHEDSSSFRRKGTKQKKDISARAVGLSDEDANAVVAEVFPNQCRVQLDQTQQDLLCSYRRANVLSQVKGSSRERTPVAVGDRVLVRQTGSSSGVVEGVCARRNCISRVAPGSVASNQSNYLANHLVDRKIDRLAPRPDAAKCFHVLAANLDAIVIVASVADPGFSTGLVDRFLVAAEVEKVPPILVLSKIDLYSNEKSEISPWQIYSRLNYPLFEVTVRQGIGIKKLCDFILGKTIVFCGESGVGKTSLLRALLKSDVGRVGDVNPFTGKGRHTTTGAILLGGPSASRWIDTPGVREFGIANISPSQLAHYFPEFREVSCAQSGCLHQDESGCQVQSLARYESYRKILDSLIK